MDIETKCVQGAYKPKNGEPRVLPIYQTTTYKYDTSEAMAKLFDLEPGYMYTRLANPTNDMVAQKITISPTWDGRNKNVTYMECIGRLMAGLAPWLSLPDDDTPEGVRRRQLREWALKSYANAVDPDSNVI